MGHNKVHSGSRPGGSRQDDVKVFCFFIRLFAPADDGQRVDLTTGARPGAAE